MFVRATIYVCILTASIIASLFTLIPPVKATSEVASEVASEARSEGVSRAISQVRPKDPATSTSEVGPKDSATSTSEVGPKDSATSKSEVNHLIALPMMRQATDYTCGVAALQALLAYFGEDVREDVLAKALHSRRLDGTRYKQIATYAQNHGLSVEYRTGMTVADLTRSIEIGRPVLCLIQACR